MYLNIGGLVFSEFFTGGGAVVPFAAGGLDQAMRLVKSVTPFPCSKNISNVLRRQLRVAKLSDPVRRDKTHGNGNTEK